MKNIFNTFLFFFFALSGSLVAQYDADTQDFIDRAETLDPNAFDLTTNHPALTPAYVKGQWDAYVKRLKADGVWASKVEILPLAWISFDALGCKLTYDTVATATNNGFVSGDYDAIQGLTGNGSSYFDSGFLADSLTQADAHLALYVNADVSTFGANFNGARDTTASEFDILAPWSDDKIYSDISNEANGRVATASAITGAGGHIIGSRTSASSHTIYRNGVNVASNAKNGGSMPAYNLYFFAYNNGGSASIFSQATLSLAHYGSGLTDQQAADSYTALDTLRFSMTAPPSVILAGGPRDIGHTDADYGYWDPSSLPTVTVTSLDDSGTGTFRDVADGVSNVRIAFAVEGEIALLTRVSLGSSVFIDGSTAPGQGIWFSGDDIVATDQSNIWIQDVTHIGGDYNLPMPHRMVDFEDQGSGVWLSSSNRFWNRLTDDGHVDSVWHNADGNLDELSELTIGAQVSVSSLTQTAGTATCVTSSAHGLTSGDLVYIDGATETEYNIGATVTVSDTTTFTYSVDAGASSPATGTPVVTTLGTAGWFYDGSDSEMVVATGNGDGSDVNNGALVVRLTKARHPDCLTLTNVSNVVITNCSFTGGTDITVEMDNLENVTYWANIGGRGIAYRWHVDARDVDLQTGAFDLDLHAKSVLFKYDGGESPLYANQQILFGRNLCIDSPDRNPMMTHGGDYLVINNVGVNIDGGPNVLLYNDSLTGGNASLIGNWYDTTSPTDTVFQNGVPELEVDADGTIYVADGSTDEANFWDGALKTDPWAFQNTGSMNTGKDATKSVTTVAGGTAQGGTTSTIQLASGAVTSDDEFNNHYVVITAGTGIGQQAFIADTTASNDTLDISPNWSTPPSTDSVYSVRYGLLPASISTTAHDTVTGLTILSATDAKDWVIRNAGPRPDRNRPDIVYELLTRAANPPASFHWPSNNGLIPANGWDPDAEDYIRRARALDPVAFNLLTIDDDYGDITLMGAVSNMIERLKDAGVWTDTAEWINMAGVSYDGMFAKLKRDTSETITYDSNGGLDGDSTGWETDADGWSAARLTPTFNQSIGGQDGAVKLVADGTSGTHEFTRSVTATTGRHYRFQVDAYISSSNNIIDGIWLRDTAGGLGSTKFQGLTQDQWVTVSVEGIASNPLIKITLIDGGSASFQDVGADDTVHFKNAFLKAVSPAEVINNNFTSGQYLAAGSGAGLTGNGSSMYIDSGYWFPNFSGNDLSMSAWISGSPASSSALIGSTNSTTAVMSIQDNTTNLLYNGPDSDAAITGSASTTGFLTLSRRSATDIAGLLNGVSDGTDTSSASVSSSAYAANVGIFARLDDVAGAENYTDGTLAAAAYGYGWTTAQTLAAYKALRNYLRTIGAN